MKKQMNLRDKFVYKRFTLDIETFDKVSGQNLNKDSRIETFDKISTQNEMYKAKPDMVSIAESKALYKMKFGGKTIIIGLYDGKEYHKFNCFKGCIDYIFSKAEKSIVYTHNAGKFDYLYYLNECINDFSLEKIIVINGGIVFNIVKDKHLTENEKQTGKLTGTIQEIRLRDSYRILKGSLKRLCKSFTPQYKKIEMDYDSAYSMPEIEEYLMYDCISLYEIIKIFEDELKTIMKNPDYSIDRFYTIASLSFNNLITKYLKGITRNHMSIPLEDFIRTSYYGGRVEIYKFHGYNLNYYDVNSLYPFVMHNYEYPIGRYFKSSNPSQIALNLEKGHLGFIDCQILYPYNYYCLLPVRTKDKELMFPYGLINGVYSTPEIKYALSQGAKIHYKKAVFWADKDKIFKDFVNDFYQLKLNSKGAKKEIAKIILNSSYGKFAQKREMNVIVSEREALKNWDKFKEYECLAKGKFYCNKQISYRNRNINPVYASFVTAYARIELYKNLIINNCFYCDTDSIICSNKMEDDLVDSKALGKFKMEVDNIIEGIFISPKMYALKIQDKINKFDDDELKYLIQSKSGIIQGDSIIYDQIKCKGVDGEAIAGINFEKMKEISQTKSFSYEKIKLIGFMQKFNRTAYKSNSSFINFETIAKSLNCKYDRRISKDGITYPIKYLDLK